MDILEQVRKMLQTHEGKPWVWCKEVKEGVWKVSLPEPIVVSDEGEEIWIDTIRLQDDRVAVSGIVCYPVSISPLYANYGPGDLPTGPYWTDICKHRSGKMYVYIHDYIWGGDNPTPENLLKEARRMREKVERILREKKEKEEAAQARADKILAEWEARGEAWFWWDDWASMRRASRTIYHIPGSQWAGTGLDGCNLGLPPEEPPLYMAIRVRGGHTLVIRLPRAGEPPVIKVPRAYVGIVIGHKGTTIKEVCKAIGRPYIKVEEV